MPFLGRPLIARLVERLAPQADELLVISNHLDDYTFLGLPLVPDVFPGRGALGGLYTALYTAREPVVAVVACDMPFVLSSLLRTQHDLLVNEDVDVVIPRSPQGLEPLHAVYRKETCLRAVHAALGAGERKMIAWLPEVRVREMPANEIAAYDPEFHSFINVNSPAEFQQAEQLARQLEQAQG